jgi:hypothetical protein
MARLVIISTLELGAGVSIGCDVELIYTSTAGALSGRDTERVAAFVQSLWRQSYFEIHAEDKVFSKCRFYRNITGRSVPFVYQRVSLAEPLTGSPSARAEAPASPSELAPSHRLRPLRKATRPEHAASGLLVRAAEGSDAERSSR